MHLAFALAAALLAPAPSRTAFDHSHAAWTEVLRTCVRDGGFDYARLKEDPAPLAAYLAELQAVTPAELAGWSEAQRFAFWINAYNAHTIHKVVENYPLESIKDLSGAFGLKSVFDREFIPMRAHHPEGKDDELSLNDIEHGILRKQFRDARLHAAINCASKSCPPLRAEAFVAERLEAQLEEQMRAFVNDPARNRIDPARKELAISQIFEWFAADFERDAGSVREYLARFAPADSAEFLRSTRLRYLDYDWDLNDVPR
jgi:hypothetical protein